MNGIAGSQGSDIGNSGKCLQTAFHKDISNFLFLSRIKVNTVKQAFLLSASDISFYILFSLICIVVALLL